MSEVFLSYKNRVDTERANRIRSELAKLGVQSFIDHSMGAGSPFLNEIKGELEAAKVVLVLWTSASIDSDWVKAEALHGFNRRVLAAALFDNVDPNKLGPPFNGIHTPDLSNWLETGAAGGNEQWQSVLRALGTLLGRPSLPALACALDVKRTHVEKARAEFVEAHPDDPVAAQFRDQLRAVAKARRDFDDRLTGAWEKFERRAKGSSADTRKRVEASRQAFETGIGAYLCGEGQLPEACPPDDIFQDRVATWRAQVQGLTRSLDEIRSRAEKAEAAAKQDADKAAELQLVIEKSAADRAAASAREAAIKSLDEKLARATVSIDERDKALASAQHDADSARLALTEREKVVQERDGEIAGLKDAVSAEKEKAEAKDRDIATLQDEIGKATRRADDATAKADKTARLLEASETLRQEAGQEIEQRDARLKQRDDDIAHLTSIIATERPDSVAKDEQIAVLTEQVRSAEFARLAAARRSRRVITGSTLAAGIAIGFAVIRILYGNTSVSAATDQMALIEGERKSLSEQVTSLSGRMGELRSANATLSKQVEGIPALRQGIDERQKQIAGLTKENNELKARLPSGPLEEAVRKCDDMTAFQFDPDRPLTSKSKSSYGEIDVKSAREACDAALKLASGKPAERRIRLQLGRTFAASGRAFAMTGNIEQSDKDFETAVGYWKNAAAMGSSHAANVLGNFYQGLLSLDRKPKNLELAWKYYNDAADAQNPVALATVGFTLLMPEGTDWRSEKYVTRNDRKGKEYLEAASRSDYAQASFLVGLAAERGRGWSPDAAKGFFTTAFCKGAVAAAAKFPDEKPVCS